MELKAVAMSDIDIRAELDRMPEYKKEALARATIEFMQRLLSQPEGRELIKRKKAEIYGKDAK
ncbi:MAG: hypothetical protein E7473_06310 [Ruminococcaceae bacterium]|nr:hypothetical protein [Oscillospiraceae bacterium]